MVKETAQYKLITNATLGFFFFFNSKMTAKIEYNIHMELINN